jgi:hypothetical protein
MAQQGAKIYWLLFSGKTKATELVAGWLLKLIKFFKALLPCKVEI